MPSAERRDAGAPQTRDLPRSRLIECVRVALCFLQEEEESEALGDCEEVTAAREMLATATEVLG